MHAYRYVVKFTHQCLLLLLLLTHPKVLDASDQTFTQLSYSCLIYDDAIDTYIYTLPICKNLSLFVQNISTKNAFTTLRYPLS